MGIVNVTPDSFSDGGRHADVASAVEHALRLMNDGALLVDVGGESTRPGSDSIIAAEDTARTVPVIRELAELGVPHRHPQARSGGGGPGCRRLARQRHRRPA